jgi:hypothetical protein
MTDHDELMEWIRSDCRLATRAGLPFENQVRALAAKGIEIRSGAAGDDPNVPECGYCRASGGGRHGALCPRGGGPGQLPAEAEPSWVLSVAVYATVIAREELASAMVRKGEDPYDTAQWERRFRQLRVLLEAGQGLPELQEQAGS